MPTGPARKTARPPSQSQTPPWKRHLLAFAGLCALALLAYSNSFTSGMVADNGPLIVGDARVHAATGRNLGLIFGRHYWFGNGESNLYRPVTTLSFLFNYAILGNGASQTGYHALNFLLHAVNLALLYVLALWILQDSLAAWLMAAIWAVHPVLTESVTNIVGRADMLAAIAVLGGLVCHVLAGRAEGRRRIRWRAALFAVVAIGMFAKENAIVVIGVLALWDYLIERPSNWRPRLVNYGVAAIPCLIYLGVRAVILAKSLAYFVPFTDNPLAGADFWTARLTALNVIGKYLLLLAWPASLSSDYSYNEIPLFSWRLGAEDWKTIAAILVSLTLLGIAIVGRRRYPKLAFFIGLFFLTLAPVANLAIVIGTPMAERFLYLPAIALAGCIALGIHRIANRRAALAAAGIVILLFAIRTWARNSDWESEKTLMESDAKAAPGSFKPHMALTTLLDDRPRALAEAAIAHRILDGLPDERNSMKAYTNFGILYREEGDRLASDASGGAAAQEWYRKSLRDLERARAIEQAFDARLRHLNRGRLQADASFGWFPVYLELGRTYLRLSLPTEAIDALQHGLLLEFRPDFFEELSKAYREMREDRQAAIALMEGLAMNSGQSQFVPDLVELYRQSAPQSCALNPNGGLNMDCPMVKEAVCASLVNVEALYSHAGRRGDAAEAAKVRTTQMACPE